MKDEKHSDSEEYEDSNSEKAIESKSDVESNKGSDKGEYGSIGTIACLETAYHS